MREFWEKISNPVWDVIAQGAIIGSIAVWGKLLFDVLQGTSEIIIYGYNNKLLSLGIIIGIYTLILFTRRCISVGVNKLIIMLFKKTDESSINYAIENKNIYQAAHMSSSFVNLVASLLTIAGPLVVLLKDINKNNAVVQDLGVIQYIKKFSLEEKLEWLKAIRENISKNMSEHHWETITKEIPWELINNKIELLTYIQQSVTKILEKELAIEAELQLKLKEINESGVFHKLICGIDSLVKSIFSFVVTHPGFCLFVVIAFIGLLWFISSHRDDLYSQGFARFSSFATDLKDHIIKVKAIITTKLDNMQNIQKNTIENLRILTQKMGSILTDIDLAKNQIANLQDQIKLQNIEIEGLKAINATIINEVTTANNVVADLVDLIHNT